jgi:phage terminase large subunit-like protein
VLDPWQRLVLDGALGERADGSWAAREVGLVVGRQNGKGSIIEARELAGLFLFGERLMLHTAHQFKTAHEGFLRIKTLIEGSDEFTRRVKRFISSTQGEMVEMVTGQRLMFIARSVNGSGRGFSCDGPLFFDEAMRLPSEAVAAMLPTQAAQANPQTWYLGSAGFPDSDVLRRLRERGMSGEAGRLAYFEWSAPDDADLLDRHAWAQANPGYGIRISEDSVEAELVLDPVDFARERLGIWQDPSGASVFGPGTWEALADPASQAGKTVTFAVDVTPDRDHASIAVASPVEGGKVHVEVTDDRDRIGWLVTRLVELKRKWRPTAIALDPGSAAGGLLGPLREAGIEPLLVNAREYGQACGELHDAVINARLVHTGQEFLTAAVHAARQKPLGEAWKWSRADGTNISPLVAVTLAYWACPKTPRKPRVINLAELAEQERLKGEDAGPPPPLP